MARRPDRRKVDMLTEQELKESESASGPNQIVNEGNKVLLGFVWQKGYFLLPRLMLRGGGTFSPRRCLCRCSSAKSLRQKNLFLRHHKFKKVNFFRRQDGFKVNDGLSCM
jgi:hypothetical protein